MLASFTFLLHVSLFIRIPSLTREQHRLHSLSRWLSYANVRLLEIMCQWSPIRIKGPPTAFSILFSYTNITTDLRFLTHPYWTPGPSCLLHLQPHYTYQ
jgi:hypothetical protein